MPLALPARLGSLDPNAFQFDLGLQELNLGEIGRPSHLIHSVCKMNETALLQVCDPCQFLTVDPQRFDLLVLLFFEMSRASLEKQVEAVEQLTSLSLILLSNC